MEGLEQLTQEVKGLGGQVKDAVAQAEKNINQNVDDKIKAAGEATEASIKVVKDEVDNLKGEVKDLRAKSRTAGMAGTGEEKTFNQNLADTIAENFDQIKELREGDDKKFQMKAVGDMSYTSNFPTGGTVTGDIRNIVLPQMQENVWLGDILPQGNTNGNSVTYPKENGGEGGAAVWESGSKPLIDFDFGSDTAHVKWIAGIVRVPREMLDDLAWLTSFIQNRMLLSLKKAENSFILNGTTGTNPVTGLLTAAQAYNGTLTSSVDRLIDASWGQIIENDHTPTDFVLHPRDAVKIGLNKSTGSGEYDLPQGSVVFANGALGIAGLRTVPTKLMAANNFLAFDRNGAIFIRRMQPELRVFDQNRDDVEKNMITFRVEERATLAVPYPKAFVKGTLTAA